MNYTFMTEGSGIEFVFTSLYTTNLKEGMGTLFFHLFKWGKKES